MWIVSLFLLAAGGWIYAAAEYQNYGHAWADTTCTALQGACDHPYFVLYATLGAATVVFIWHHIRRR